MADMVTADDSGLLCVWRSGPEFKLMTQIPGFGVPCPSVQLWHGTVAAGYGDGQVRLYEASTGTLHVQISAHARAICALDLAPEVGKVSLLLHPYIPVFLVLGCGEELHRLVCYSVEPSPWAPGPGTPAYTRPLSARANAPILPPFFFVFIASLCSRGHLCTHLEAEQKPKEWPH